MKVHGVPAPRGVRIAGTGSFVPEGVLTNDDLARMVDTSDEWIRKRTGIAERRWVEGDVGASELAVPPPSGRSPRRSCRRATST